MNKEVICISLDSDWAPEEVSEYSLNLLSKYNISATFFLTNELKLKIVNHEISLHPNFLSVPRLATKSVEADKEEEKILSNLLSIYPESKGVRTHSLYHFNRLNDMFTDFGIRYISNIEMPFQPKIKPFITRDNLVQFPIFFMDDFVLKNHKFISERIDDLLIPETLADGSPGLKVFDFHPIHIFLNTRSQEHYSDCKKYYHEPRELEKRRHKGRGIGTLFEELLSLISSKKSLTKTLIEIEREYRLEVK